MRQLSLLRNWFAKHRLLNSPNVIISAETKIQFKNIILKKNCTLRIDEKSIVEGIITFDKSDARIHIGKRVFIGASSRLVCAEKIEIQDDVMISWGCTIVDHNSHSTVWDERRDDVCNWFHGQKDWTCVLSKQVTIESKAWLGFNVVVLKGVTIGEGSIVGAGSVVTKNVAPYTIVAGNPARFIREVDHE